MKDLLHPKEANGRRWAVVLAGGEGTRLRPLTRQMYGDERPKQFCPILDGKTLIASTRTRLVPVVPPDRTVFVVVENQQRYYRTELADVHPSRLVVQPGNKGTSAAIVYGLLRICHLDREAIVGFFPTDHHYANEEALRRAVEIAYGVARRSRDSLVVLAADPTGPEVDYGWIEPHPRSRNHSRHVLYRVNRFREKPSPQLAQRIFERGGLWSTFTTVGRAAVFLEILEQTIPDVLRPFHALRERPEPDREKEVVRRIYEELPSGDFSRQVLSLCTDRLIALRSPNAGWSDLGDPERVAAAMAQVMPKSERRMDSAA